MSFASTSLRAAASARTDAAEYGRKAMLLLQRAQDGQLDAAQAERLATDALGQKEQADQRAAKVGADAEQQSKMASQLQEKVQTLKSTIQHHENELVTLKARAKTAASTKKINQQLAAVDSSSTIAMLERMKNKVEEDEALAEGYAQVADLDGGVDSEIDRALAGPCRLMHLW